MTRTEIFNTLWVNYTQQNPSVQKVYNSFVRMGEAIINDHIALRTFNDSRVNIAVLEKPFIDAGYVEMGTYNFDDKKLFAKHYEVPDAPDEPKVFISELLAHEFSDKVQQIISQHLDSVPDCIYNDPKLIFKGNVWQTPSWESYNMLREESEYAAWLYVFGFRANHFTISINALKKLNTIEKVNQHLKNNGFLLNTAGGEIKGTSDDLLQQSSILAEKIRVNFKEGIFEIPACYYEFAIRYNDNNGKLYNGFVAKNANKIFESTNFHTT